MFIAFDEGAGGAAIYKFIQACNAHGADPQT